jgi:hypothetical protein
MVCLREVFDHEFQPYAIEIGYFVRDWNYLCELLRTMFAELEQGNAPFEVWNAIKHDRTQREMLRAVAESVLAPAYVADPDPRGKDLFGEISWLLRKMDGFGQERDNLIHAPLAFRLTSKGEIEWVPDDLQGHERAGKLQKSLKGKKLLEQLQLYRKKAADLVDFTKQLNTKLRGYLQETDLHSPMPPRPQS